MEPIKNYYAFINESFKVEEIDPEKWEDLPAPSSLPKLSLISSEYREDFAKKVSLIADAIGVEPEHLMMVMYKESGLKPSIVNSIGAVGLIQFIPSTLAGMINPNTNKAYTQSEVKKMDPVEQLDLVYSYLKNSSLKNAAKTSEGKLEDPADLYLSIFLPTTIGKPDSYTFPPKFVKGNEGLFPDNPEHNLGKLREHIRKNVLSMPESEWMKSSDEGSNEEGSTFTSMIKKFSNFLETGLTDKKD